jgi:hypothetical protein
MASSLDTDLQPRHKYINIMEKCFKRKDEMGLEEGKGGPCPINAEAFP